MRNTFRIHFYINRSKEKDGMVPIMGRITINGTIASFSCKQTIEVEMWSAIKNMAIGKNEKQIQVNNLLEVFRSKIIYTYQMMLLSRKVITARMVKDEVFGKGNDYATLVDAMENHIKKFSLQVGRGRSVKTLQKMEIVSKHLRQYIKFKYNRKDIILQEVTEEFILGFSRYLIAVPRLSQSTVWVYCTFLKKVIMDALSKGIISENPFRNIKLKANCKVRSYLSEAELKNIMGYLPDCPKIRLVLDAFIFCCFTGISFIDLKNLKQDNLVIIGGEKWIIARRQKNNMLFQIKLMKLPQEILNRHSNTSKPYLLNLPSYETSLKCLKKICLLCGIEKNITFHMARHTFATMALTNGMPIESISKILGHSNITTTQIYAKIINQKLSADITLLEQKVESIFKKTKRE